MPHVTVHFDPTKASQELVDRLKRELEPIVANAMSYLPGVEQNPKEICVRQQAAHPTDVNPAAIEIEIQAGNARERDPDEVVQLIITEIYRGGLTVGVKPEECCVWLRFNGNNAFAWFFEPGSKN